MGRLIATTLTLIVFTLLLCGCNAAKQTDPFSCAAYPNGLTLSPGTGDQYCVTPSSASYQISEQGSEFNSYSVSVTLQSNPPIPTGTTVQVSLQPDIEGQGQVVSTGSSTMAFSFTVTTNTSETCLPNPVTVSANAFSGAAGGLLQASWTSVPEACSSN